MLRATIKANEKTSSLSFIYTNDKVQVLSESLTYLDIRIIIGESVVIVVVPMFHHAQL